MVTAVAGDLVFTDDSELNWWKDDPEKRGVEVNINETKLMIGARGKSNHHIERVAR